VPSAETPVISARGHVRERPQAVYARLADLDEHRHLVDAGMRILALDGPAGRRSGGLVELRGPAGLRRVARTRVKGAEPGRRLWGTATTTDGTEAELEWRLHPHEAGTEVEIELRLRSQSPRDRLLLRMGGERWLRQRLAAAIARL